MAVCTAVLLAGVAPRADRLQHAAGIRGLVVDSAGAPVENAEIEIRRIDPVPAIGTRSGGDGRFAVPNLEPGTYRVIASRAGLGFDTNENIRLLPGMDARLQLTLTQRGACALAALPGTGAIAGTVVDWHGAPGPAHVRLESTGADTVRLRSEAGVDGRYEFELLPPGRYTLQVSIPALEPIVSTVVVEPDRTHIVETRLTLDRRRSTAPDPEAGAPLPTLAAGTGGINGRAVDMSGAVLPGVSASVRTADGGTRKTVTDSAGRFRIGDLPPGRYELHLSLAGFQPSASPVVISAGEWTDIVRTLEVGILQPSGSALNWKMRPAESAVRVETDLGAFTLAVDAPDFLACLDLGAYQSGTLAQQEGLPPAAPVLRFTHNDRLPAAAGATSFALRLDAGMPLVAIDPATGRPGKVVGRVVDGAATARALRDQIAGARGRPVSIVSITRLVFL
jgi:hypothetical protein